MVATPVITLACILPTFVQEGRSGKWDAAILGELALMLYLAFAAQLFASEPPGPSRRVRAHWHRDGAPRLRRFMGPGLARTAMLVVGAGLLAVFAVTSLCLLALDTPGLGSTNAQQRVLYFASYAGPFFVFVVGFTAWVRARGSSPWIARLISCAVLLLITAGPWIVAAIGGAFAGNEGAILIGAPSPAFTVVMLRWVGTHNPAQPVIEVGIGFALVWGLLGVVFLHLAGRRCARAVAQYDEAVAKAEAALEEEERVSEAPAPPTNLPEAGSEST